MLASNKLIQNKLHFQLTKPSAKNSNRRLRVFDCMSAGEKSRFKWQITDCSFPSSSQSNKWARWRLNTPQHTVEGGRVTDIDLSTIKAKWIHSAFSTQRSVGRKGLHADYLVLFTLYISTTLVYLRTTSVLQHSENEASSTMLWKAACVSESSQGRRREKDVTSFH